MQTITIVVDTLNEKQLIERLTKVQKFLQQEGLAHVECYATNNIPILKPWVMDLGLRHQGVLVSAVRGCDTSPKNDATKALTRCYREVILESYNGNPAKAASFIELVDHDELLNRFNNFRKNCDHLPTHYVLHFMHAAEIIGYYHPDSSVREDWSWFYFKMCDAMHMNMETKEQLEKRLNAPEDMFRHQNRMCELENNCGSNYE
jgi:hypothetical protein